MSELESQDLKTTALTAWHREHGGRMVAYAGYEMPVQYRGVLAEHAKVRDKVGLFDITHMGEILVSGSGAEAWLDGLTTNRVVGLEIGKIVYTAMCRPDGGVLDDMLIYHLDETEWMVVCNAANHEKIAAWLNEHVSGVDHVELEDITAATALIAVQGPEAADLMKHLDALSEHVSDLESLDFYQALVHDGPGGRWVISRTGYTGEHGYELYVPNADALALWEELMAKGESSEIEPIGLAARDTLRFEVAYCLYGHELGEDILPLEAGIGWAVRMKNRDFIGRDAIRAMKTEGAPRKLLGIEVLPPAGGERPRPAPIARQGAMIYAGERLVGAVTSGTKSPTLECSLALALLETGAADLELEVEIRNRRVPVRVVPLPFLSARVKGDPRAERS